MSKFSRNLKLVVAVQGVYIDAANELYEVVKPLCTKPTFGWDDCNGLRCWMVGGYYGADDTPESIAYQWDTEGYQQNNPEDDDEHAA